MLVVIVIICVVIVDDVVLILCFICELVIYEKVELLVQIDEVGICVSLFGVDVKVYVLICEVGGEVIGYVVYFYNYFIWLGCNGIYLEDLYVSLQQCGSGVGKVLLQYIVCIVVVEGCGCFEWLVLDWNELVIRFYEVVGVKLQSEWMVYCMEGDVLWEFVVG